MGVFWPPSYYILRDRIPFFLTICFIYRYRVSRLVRDYLGYYLALSTMIVVSVSTFLYLDGMDMTRLSGINWSPPSPIEWGLFILASYLVLFSRGMPSFEAYYLSFIAALGGGWLYEFLPFLVPLLFNGYSWSVFFKVNAIKVFFIEFQVLCLPILAYIIYNTKVYEAHWSIKITAPLTLLFYGFNQMVIAFVQQNLLYSYRWWVRLPAMFFLLSIILGIKGEKTDAD